MGVMTRAPVDVVDGRRWLPWPSARWGRDALGSALFALVLLLPDLVRGALVADRFVLVLVGCGLLAARRTAPVPVLAAELVVVAGATVVSDLGDATLMYAVALYTAVERAPSLGRSAATGLLGTVALVVVVSVLSVDDPEIFTREFGALTVAGLAVGTGLAVGGVRKAAAHERDLTDRDHAAAVRQRIAEERVRIARDLHDVVGHEVAVVTVQAGLASHLMESRPARAAEALERVQEAGARVLEELPVLLKVLRQSGDIPAEAAVGLPQIDELVAHARAAGTDVDLDRGEHLPALAASADIAAYRVVQEALTNAAKHGDGSVRVGLSRSGHELVVEVENGLGTPGAPGSGLGLVGMRERVEAADGRLDAGVRGGTFVVRAVLPGRAARSDARPREEQE